MFIRGYNGVTLFLGKPLGSGKLATSYKVATKLPYEVDMGPTCLGVALPLP